MPCVIICYTKIITNIRKKLSKGPSELQFLLGLGISQTGKDSEDVKVSRAFENQHVGVGKGLAHGTEALDQCRPEDIQFFFGFVKNCLVANGAMFIRKTCISGFKSTITARLSSGSPKKGSGIAS